MSSNLIDRTMDWGIAKLVKASDSESDMRRFESYYPCQSLRSFPNRQFGQVFAVVAKLVDALS